MRREFGQQRGGKGIAPVAQLLRSLPGQKRADDDVADNVREIGETAGEFLGGGDVHRLLRKKTEQKMAGAFEFVRRNRREFAAGGDMGEAEGFALLAVHKPAELDDSR